MAKLASGELDSKPGAMRREAAAAFREAAHAKRLHATALEDLASTHHHNGNVYENYRDAARILPSSDLQKSSYSYDRLSEFSFRQAFDIQREAAKVRKEARHDRRQYYKHAIMGVVETVAAKIGL
jgi:hypothetical protein